jgi:type IV secretion system protein VirB10
MAVREIGDPRLQALFGASDPREAGVRPTVRLPRKGLPPIVLAAVALVLAVLLFSVLNARRTAQHQPSVGAQVSDSAAETWAPPPPLYVPPVEQPVSVPVPPEQEKPSQKVVAAPAPAPFARAVPGPSVVAQPVPQFAPVAPSAPPERISSGSPLVIDSGNGSNSAATSPGGGVPFIAGPSGQSITRIRASALANRSMTVPQGYLIPAVLETGFDSTKPGFARAIVSRDVRGFDGKNVLIPRGSRLIGEYHSETSAGQNRAIIMWTRLMRPDGMTIALDSPAVDTLGRGGVAASVNTHFFARLGDALLQSTFAIGQALAGRAVTGPVVVLQGGTAQAAAQIAPARNYVPTLTVAPGRSISVFVAHDLDFTAAGSVR